MKNNKINPEVVGKSVRTVHKEYPWNNEIRDVYDQIIEKEIGGNEVYDIRRRSGYLDARSSFLKSYSFENEKEKGWRKTMKRKAKETNQKAKLALVKMGKKAMVSSKKFDVKLLAMKFDIPMGAMAMAKCFAPTIHRKKA
ncbi:hypothetical protein QQ045_023902 [Rhodiola kirilowii]